MALWRYEIELQDGRREANVLAAGNHRAACARAERNAAAVGARVVGDVRLVDSVKGTL